MAGMPSYPPLYGYQPSHYLPLLPDTTGPSPSPPWVDTLGPSSEPLPPGVDRYPPLYECQLPHYPPLRSYTSCSSSHHNLISVPESCSSPNAAVSTTNPLCHDNNHMPPYDKITRSLQDCPPPPLHLLRISKYRTPPSITATVQENDCDMIFMIKWASPAAVYGYEDTSISNRYTDEQEMLLLRIHFAELVKPAIEFRHGPPRSGILTEGRSHRHLLPLFTKTFSCHNVTAEQRLSKWEKSFLKHLNHADKKGRPKGYDFSMSGCAEFIIACNYHFDMPYLQLEMRKNALDFARRQTVKYNRQCVCEVVTHVGIRGKYKMRARDVWVLMRDILGPAFCPHFSTSKEYNEHFLHEITLFVNKDMQPTTYKNTKRYPPDNPLVIF